ncbi:heparan-alpha-glucosaminide N-acetyltransferase domain-containing protein [Actinomyces sp. zg296]|uniref:heparan-alpha-glucosaminide N-acetyltransferase domain-containing protein n=1 Tax=Actinomyces sp. zg296 TaxID=2609289 RepID=UPI0013586EB8|nr:heparan-alpha-glucosaminide N-acetyltransferase domain-containing protein [Actinomyces sp. zg296]
MTSTSAAAPPGPAPDPASWRLRLRRGPYLTGTAGKARLIGLDAARGVALFGMAAAHVGVTSCGLDTLPGWLNLAHGRSAVLFAIIAGFSLGIMSGRETPHTGERLLRTRLRILVRAVLLMAIAGALITFTTGVAIILGYYAAWFAVALPVLHWGARRLLIAAAATAALGPLVLKALPLAMARLGLASSPAASDGSEALLGMFITGAYPGAVWMSFIFLGMGLARMGISGTRRLVRLAAIGALCAVLGYGGAYVLTRAAGADEPDAFHLAVPTSRGASVVGSDGLPEPEADRAVKVEMPSCGDGEAISGSSEWPVLLSAKPHTNSFFEAVGSGGVAVAVIALLSLLASAGAWARWLLAPLAAMGSMSLTIYSAHIVAIWAFDLTSVQTNRPLMIMMGVLAAFAMAWLAVFVRGPMEHVVHVISLRATRAPSTPPPPPRPLPLAETGRK